MKHISILIPKGQYSIVNIAGTHQMLLAADEMYRAQTGEELFRVEMVSDREPAFDSVGLYSIRSVRNMNEITQTDLIIIPAVHNTLDEVLTLNQQEIDWVKTQYKSGAQIATFCIGVFLLAATGILDGQSCSTHWGYASALQQRFPKVRVIAENIVTENDGIYTSGGAYAFTNLVIYLVEKFGGRELAIMTAKSFMIDVDRNSQSPFMVFNGQKDHRDDVVLRVQEYIETNYAERFTVDELASVHATIRRTLERRFKKATGNSINEYTQRVRTEAAKKHLELGRKSVGEVLFEVGYSDPKAFRDVFKKWVGLSPVEYRNKYNAAYIS